MRWLVRLNWEGELKVRLGYWHLGFKGGKVRREEDWDHQEEGMRVSLACTSI